MHKVIPKLMPDGSWGAETNADDGPSWRGNVTVYTAAQVKAIHDEAASYWQHRAGPSAPKCVDNETPTPGRKSLVRARKVKGK